MPPKKAAKRRERHDVDESSSSADDVDSGTNSSNPLIIQMASKITITQNPTKTPAVTDISVSSARKQQHEPTAEKSEHDRDMDHVMLSGTTTDKVMLDCFQRRVEFCEQIDTLQELDEVAITDIADITELPRLIKDAESEEWENAIRAVEDFLADDGQDIVVKKLIDGGLVGALRSALFRTNIVGPSRGMSPLPRFQTASIINILDTLFKRQLDLAPEKRTYSIEFCEEDGLAILADVLEQVSEVRRGVYGNVRRFAQSHFSGFEEYA